MLASPALDTIPPSDVGSGDTGPSDVPEQGGPGESPPGDGAGDTGRSFRIVDPPASQGLFETIVGGVAGFFLGG